MQNKCINKFKLHDNNILIGYYLLGQILAQNDFWIRLTNKLDNINLCVNK